MLKIIGQRMFRKVQIVTISSAYKLATLLLHHMRINRLFYHFEDLLISNSDKKYWSLIKHQLKTMHLKT
jgi:hypothetical protein